MYQQKRFFRSRRQPHSFDPSFLVQQVRGQSPLEVVAITNDFADFSVEEQIKINVQKKGYLIPTPIQDKVIPLILTIRMWSALPIPAPVKLRLF